jgi:hypothetical protein
MEQRPVSPAEQPFGAADSDKANDSRETAYHRNKQRRGERKSESSRVSEVHALFYRTRHGSAAVRLQRARLLFSLGLSAASVR